MLKIIKNKLEPEDYTLVISEGLVNTHGDYYDLTLKAAIDELTEVGYIEHCEYEVGISERGKELLNFTAWTKDLVIFSVRGMFYEDCFLSSVKRNPQI